MHERDRACSGLAIQRIRCPAAIAHIQACASGRTRLLWFSRLLRPRYAFATIWIVGASPAARPLARSQHRHASLSASRRRQRCIDSAPFPRAFSRVLQSARNAFRGKSADNRFHDRRLTPRPPALFLGPHVERRACVSDRSPAASAADPSTIAFVLRPAHASRVHWRRLDRFDRCTGTIGLPAEPGDPAI